MCLHQGPRQGQHSLPTAPGVLGKAPGAKLLQEVARAAQILGKLLLARSDQAQADALQLPDPVATASMSACSSVSINPASRAAAALQAANRASL